MSSKDNDEQRVMHLRSDNTEIMIDDKADEVRIKLYKNMFSPFFLNIKLGWKHQLKILVLSLIVVIYCITNVMK